MKGVKLGSHVKLHNSQTAAALIGAQVVQVCFGSPRSWGSTLEPRNPFHTMMIHAPYLINFSGSKRVLDLSLKTMLAQGRAGAKYGAKGLVIHGGSFKEHKDKQQALDQWFHATSEYTDEDFEAGGNWPPIFVENAASGKYSLTRHTDDIFELWADIHDQKVEFCIDTAHLWASIGKPEEAEDFIKEVIKLTGPVKMVHANGSAVKIGTGMDRHSPLEVSEAPADWVAWCIQLCDPDYVITETTAPAQDLAILRSILFPEGDPLD